MEENLELKTIQEELQKIDKDYFHTCVEVDDKNNIKWRVYYSNINDKDYLKRTNKPILDSANNDMEDVRILNKNFEKYKEKTKSGMFFERFDLYFDMFVTHRAISESIQKIFESISYSMLGLMLLLFVLNIDNKIFAAVGLTITLFEVITSLLVMYHQDKVEKCIDELKEKEEKRLLKAYLKDKEMKGLKDEFTKKDRKKFIKENKEYRSKRKAV